MESSAQATRQEELDHLHPREFKPYLTEKVNYFQAGNIKSHLREWKQYTKDKEILATVTGLPVECSNFGTGFQQKGGIMDIKFSQKETEFLSKEIDTLLQKRVIVESEHEAGEFISPIFLVPKTEDSYRMILNLKKLNENVPYIHFKMETINSILTLVTQNCYMAKIDIKDAYYSIPILEEHQKYLKFYYNGKLYKFTCLPNGLCSGPRKFTKLLKPPLSTLRLQQVTVAGFIDDLITVAESFIQCERNIKLIVVTLDRLGFTVHPEKSIFTPVQIIEYLGFIINSQRMIVSLTYAKKVSIKEFCREILEEKFVVIRKVASLLGKFTSSFPAVQYGKLHYRALERDKIVALKFSKGNFDKKMKISQEGREDILWWLNNIGISFNPIHRKINEFALQTDASKTGWGAVFNRESTGGSFSLKESELHINVLELKAVLFGLKSLCGHLQQTHLKILSDNTTAVCTINNMGSCKSQPCDQIVREIWDWAIEKDIFLTAAHIPGVLNVEADMESRNSELRTEWKLHESIFKSVQLYFDFFPTIDLFASRLNTQLPRFFSYRPDPEAEVINAFCVLWTNIKFYCFPPFSCVGKVLQKIIFDQATGILIVPNWPNQFWYTTMQKILIKPPFFIEPKANHLYLPNQPDTEHPFFRNIELLACLVSGRVLQSNSTCQKEP